MNCTDKSLEQIMDYHYRCIQPAAFMEAPEMSYLDYVHQKLTRSRTHDSVDGENVFFCEREDKRLDGADEDVGLDEDKEQKYQSQSVKFIQKFVNLSSLLDHFIILFA
jgi:hypothetical protein